MVPEIPATATITGAGTQGRLTLEILTLSEVSINSEFTRTTIGFSGPYDILNAGLPLIYSLCLMIMSREVLGNFELMVMLAIIRLGDAVCGVPISKAIEESTSCEVLVSSVYAALERLEEKGLVASKVGEPTPERDRRAKRYFRITEKGLRQVRAMRGVLIRLWQGIPALQGVTR